MNIDNQGNEEQKNSQLGEGEKEIKKISDTTNASVLQALFRQESIMNRIFSIFGQYSPSKDVDKLELARKEFQWMKPKD